MNPATTHGPEVLDGLVDEGELHELIVEWRSRPVDEVLSRRLFAHVLPPLLAGVASRFPRLPRDEALFAAHDVIRRTDPREILARRGLVSWLRGSVSAVLHAVATAEALGISVETYTGRDWPLVRREDGRPIVVAADHDVLEREHEVGAPTMTLNESRGATVFDELELLLADVAGWPPATAEAVVHVIERRTGGADGASAISIPETARQLDVLPARARSQVARVLLSRTGFMALRAQGVSAATAGAMRSVRADLGRIHWQEIAGRG